MTAQGEPPISALEALASDGTLTGYGGGLWRKRRLLDLEAGALALA